MDSKANGVTSKASSGQARGSAGHNSGKGSNGNSKRVDTWKPTVADGKVEGITLRSNPLVVHNQVLAWTQKYYPKLKTCIEHDTYVMDRVTTQDQFRRAIKAAISGDLSLATGLGNVIFRDQLGTMPSDESPTEDTPAGRADIGDAAAAAAQAQAGDGSAAAAAAEVPVPGPIDRAIDAVVTRVWEKRLTHWFEDADDLQTQKREGFTALWSKCAPGVRAALEAHDEWVVIKREEDFLLFWSLLKVTLIGGGYLEPRDRYQKVHQEFMALQKHPKESLDHFKERFDMMVSMCTFVELKFEDWQLADFFVSKLDHYFDELKAAQYKTGNFPGARHKGERFANVEEAFQGAQTELNANKKLKQSSALGAVTGFGNRNGLAFVGRGNNGAYCKGGGKKSKHRKADIESSDDEPGNEPKCGRCGGKGHEESNCSSKDSCHVTCFGCGGKGHYKDNCPTLA